jgi:catechol 2,3-dioxygenase-like lactoylglutathione lyase family enzyme
LPLVAPARLHKRSILSAQIRDEKTDLAALEFPDRTRDHLPCREGVELFVPLMSKVRSGETTLAHVSGRGTNNEAIVPTAQPSAGALVRWACRSDNRTRVGRVTLQRMDNVGIVVESLDAAISFFAELGLELEGRATIEGDWAERVTGLRHMRVEIAMMRTPDGHSRLEISRFLTPPAVADHRNAPVNALGYLRIMFAVEDIDDTLARLRPHGAELVGELAQYEDKYRLCYVRGPEGILIGLAEQIG